MARAIWSTVVAVLINCLLVLKWPPAPVPRAGDSGTYAYKLVALSNWSIVNHSTGHLQIVCASHNRDMSVIIELFPFFKLAQ
jgi:hypothetical protein